MILHPGHQDKSHLRYLKGLGWGLHAESVLTLSQWKVNAGGSESLACNDPLQQQLARNWLRL